MTETQRRRAVLYQRISSDPKQRELGVERQEKANRALAERLDADVVAVFTDNDLTAYSDKPREDYVRMLEFLRTGGAEMIIAWDTERLYRRDQELNELIHFARLYDLEIQTQEGPLNLRKAAGRLTARIKSAVGSYDIEHGQERMWEEKEAAADKGLWRGGSRPTGYEKDGLTLRPNEAKAIHDAMKQVLATNDTDFSLGEIARQWIELGIENPRGGTWTRTSVKYVLCRWRNAGISTHKGEVRNKKAQWATICAEHETLGVRAKLLDPARSTTDVRIRKHLGSGLFRCGVCADGTTVKVGSSGGSRGRRQAYRCRGGSHLTRPITYTDAYVTEVVLAYLKRPEAKLRLYDVPESEIAKLQDEANAIRAELEGLAVDLGNREIDRAAYKIAAGRMNEDLKRIEAKLQESSARSPLNGIANADDVEEAWEAVTLGRKRAVIDALFEITLLKGRPGRQPGGRYFNPKTVQILPKHQAA